MSSPTQRTLRRAEKLGYTAQVVEKWVPQARRRIDLFGCIDVVACVPGRGILGIQTTSATHHAERVEKAKAEPRMAEWLAAGGRFEVWSWKKNNAGRWECRVEELELQR